MSCSTKKNKWLNRAYHNTTAKFNGYFNGEEAYKEGVSALETAHIDNYYKILPVFRMGTIDDSKTFYPVADKAIKKASVVIKKHSMFIKGKEYCRYIDDSYLLIGKSLFYKRDYYASIEMFNYVAKEPVKNYKKDPIAHLGNTWLARGYSELGMFSDAQNALDRSLNDKSIPNKIKGRLYATLTDFYLKQNNYLKAQESVNEAIKFTKNKKFRTRLIFIYAQLLQKNNELGLASQMYKKVNKMNPSYEMSFYASINTARCFNSENSNSTEIRSLLSKMLKDPKNLDFNDQIYYVLGEIEEKEEKDTKAIEQYLKSTEVSTNNTNQKGLSHLAIAEIYFRNREYRTSAAYYDSAVTFLSKEYENIKQVENKRNSLAELVKKYEKIQLYDSLLQISKLSKEEIDKKVEEQIKREQEQRKKQKEKEAAQAALQAAKDAIAANSSGNTSGPAAGGNGLWYFYNPSAMSFGLKEFKKLWGERKLEDNWRRSNKQTTAPVNNGSANTDDTSGVAKKDEKAMTKEDSIAADKKRLTELIPNSDEQKKAYADSVLEAFQDLGMIYKEKLGDLKEAAATYEDFLNRYPGNQYEPRTLYQLFRIYLTLKDQTKADKYKQLILTKYPDSEYARIISDPEFYKQQNLGKKEAEIYYAETYRLYQARQYVEVLNRCRIAETKYVGNALMPKFALLKAMSIGQTKDVVGFRMSLQDIIKSYPDDGAKTKAQELLDGLDKAQGIAPKDTAAPKAELYLYKPDTTHFYVVAFEDAKMNLNDFKSTLSDFNTEFFSTKNLQISSKIAGTNYQIVVVQQFDNKKSAQNYTKIIDDDDVVFANMDMNIIDSFVISIDNYGNMLREGKVEEYIQFFKKVYQ
jgi:tetratricopeptide (TPR) repeat protein